jgi:hypothetical protein
MARLGDRFAGTKDNTGGPKSNLYAPTELRWTDRVLYALNSMLGIDTPEKARLSVFVDSYALGRPKDPPVDLLTANTDQTSWNLIGFLKAFSPLALNYDAKLNQISSELTSISSEINLIHSETQDINAGLTGLIAEVQANGIVLAALSAQAADIRARMDAPFQTYL